MVNKYLHIMRIYAEQCNIASHYQDCDRFAWGERIDDFSRMFSDKLRL